MPQAIKYAQIDWTQFRGERQQAPRLEEIHPGHVERYLFATTLVFGSVLDAACGCGYGSRMMFDKTGEVTGIDLEPEAIAYAEYYYHGPEYLVSDVSSYQGEYDWVVSFETLEHLKDPLIALKQFRGSKNLICSTPNQLRYPFDKKKFEGDRFPHQKHYRPKELEKLLKTAGWKVREKFCQQLKKSPVTPGTDGMFLIFRCE